MTKKKLTDFGDQVPQNLKFGILVVVALFWADFFKSLLQELLAPWLSYSASLTPLMLALAATVLAYLLFQFYRKIVWRLKKLKF